MGVGATGSITTTGGMEGALGLSTDGILYGATGLAIVGINVDNVGDEGGWPVVGSGVFPTYIGMYVWIVVPDVEAPGYTLRRCFSGVHTQEFVCWSTTASTLSFVVPALPISPAHPGTPLPFNPFDIYIETTDGLLSSTGAAMLPVVHRTYTTNLYGVRATCPPPRDVGPYGIDGEDYGG